jgi:Tfp pilus assembly protein PilF
LYQSWASMELREENFSASKILISQALTLDKRNAGGWLIAAEIEAYAGNEGLVNLLLRRGIECAPTSAKLYCALGEALVRRGKINEAREILEEGMEVDPMYAPLYHSLAELEARVFNLEGLNKLNKRAASIFNSNALDPAPSSSEIWGSKIRAGRSRIIPKGVAALAQRIVEEDVIEPSFIDSDPETFLDQMMSSSNLLEDGLVGQLLNMEEK